MTGMYEQFIAEDLIKLKDIENETLYYYKRSSIRLMGGDFEMYKMIDYIINLLERDFNYIKKRMITNYGYKTIPQLFRRFRAEDEEQGRKTGTLDYLFT